MTYRLATLIFFLAFLFQASLLNLISIFGATPNMILCLVIVFAFLYDQDNFGIVLGVVFGLLYDICFMPVVGVSAMLYFLIALAVMFSREILNKENIGTVLLMTAVATFAFNLLTWCMYWVLGNGISIMTMLRVQPLQIIWNLVVVSILYAVVIRKVIKHRRDRFYQ